MKYIYLLLFNLLYCHLLSKYYSYFFYFMDCFYLILYTLFVRGFSVFYSEFVYLHVPSKNLSYWVTKFLQSREIHLSIYIKLGLLWLLEVTSICSTIISSILTRPYEYSCTFFLSLFPWSGKSILLFHISEIIILWGSWSCIYLTCLSGHHISSFVWVYVHLNVT